MEEEKKKEIWNTKEEKKEKHGFLDENVTIKFNLKKAIKWSLIIAILVLVFFGGRWSVGDNDTSVPDTANSSFFGGISTLLDSEEVKSDKITAAVVSNDTEEEIVPKPVIEPEPEEEVITTYKHVAIALNDVDVNWKDTWGKITRLKYTIKNNEVGTIKPDHFIMTVLGYEDLEKVVPLMANSKSVKSGVSVSSIAIIPGGFSYSDITLDDLSSVKITLRLYDISNTEMAIITTNMNLEAKSS